MQVDYQIAVGQGNGSASPVGLIRKVVILAIKSDGHWQFACMHPRMWVHIYQSAASLYLSNLPTSLISKAFRVKAENGKSLNCCIKGMELRMGTQNSREEINKK